MAAEDLPEKFDVVILGTGFLECILAAAFARVGYSVLHIDRNDYYCGDWAAFNLQGVDRWAKEQQGNQSEPLQRPKDPKLLEGDVLVDCPLSSSTNTNILAGFNVGPEEVTISACDKDFPDKSSPEIDTSAADISSQENTPCDIKTESETSACVEGTSTVDNTSCDIQSESDLKTKHVVADLSGSEKSTDPCQISTEDCTKNQVTGVLESDKRGDNREGEITPDNESGQDGAETEDCSKNKVTGVLESDKRGDNREGEITPDNESGQVGAESNKEVEPIERLNKKCEDIQSKEETKPWTKTSIEKEWRKFNIDLAPRLLYCRGEMVELLIDSDVSKYCEFKTVTRVLTWLKDQLQQVPCSRADVFSSKSVSMIEKRMMMKFLMFCMDYQKHPEEYKDYADKPFTEFLDSRKLKPNIRHFIQHSIAMATDSITTLEGLESTHKFITSLGRYGNTAFLWPLYGSGELPQSFARMCAVFAGIYCLRMTASSIISDKDNKYRGILTTEGHRVESRWLIAESSYLPVQYLQTEGSKRVTSRGIFMTDKSIKSSDSEELSLLYLPCPDDPQRPVSVLELPSSSMATPKGLYLVHLTREGSLSCSPEEDLKYAVDTLFTSATQQTQDKPAILWYLYFNQANTCNEELSKEAPEGITHIPGPGAELHMDGLVIQAKEIFSRLLPEEEFLPKAPNPEDIIYDEGKNTQRGEGFAAQEGDSPTKGKVQEGNSLKDSTINSAEMSPNDDKTKIQEIGEESSQSESKETNEILNKEDQ